MRLLYFSPVEARSYAQRPHFLVRAWLNEGAESVLWVNPYPCRLPRWADLRRLRGDCPNSRVNENGTVPFGPAGQATPLDPRITVLTPPALPIEPLPLGTWLNRHLLWRRTWRTIERYAAGGRLAIGVGRPSAMALRALRELRPASSFFDAMDNFPEFHCGLSRRAMNRHEEAIAAEADVVLASSTFLAEKFTRRGLRVEKILNGCDGSNDECGMINDECRHTPVIHHSSFIIHHSPSATFGYLGCLGHWFDWRLVIRLAEAVPRAAIELVGPCPAPRPRRLPPNVRLLPACSHAEAAGHLRRFSAGLIPFHRNALTAGVDPIKFYEYRAAGLPVLSTSFGEMALRGRGDGVYFLDQTENLGKLVSAALADRTDASETRRFRRENDWSRRFRQSKTMESLWRGARMRRAA